MKKCSIEQYEEFYQLILDGEITIEQLETEIGIDEIKNMFSWVEIEKAHNPKYKAINLISESRINAKSLKERINKITEAIKLYPDLIEGYIELFLIEKGFYKKLKRIDKAIEIGRNNLNMMIDGDMNYADFKKLLVALEIKAEYLIFNGIREEAVSLFEEVLEYNENDILGVRYKIVPEYFIENRDDDALYVLEKYIEDNSIHMIFNRALYEFRNYNYDESEKYLKLGMDKNPLIVKAICHDKEYDKLFENSDLNIAPDVEEAQDYLEHARDAWRKTEGALFWLLNQIELDKKNKVQ